MLVTIFLDPVFWLTSDMPISYIRPTSYFSSMFRNDLIILYPDSKNTRQHCNSHSVNHALMGSEGKRMPSKQKWVKHDDMNERPGSLMPWTIISSIGHTAANGASPRRHRGYLSQAEQEEAVTRGHHCPGNQDCVMNVTMPWSHEEIHVHVCELGPHVYSLQPWSHEQIHVCNHGGYVNSQGSG